MVIQVQTSRPSIRAWLAGRYASHSKPQTIASLPWLRYGVASVDISSSTRYDVRLVADRPKSHTRGEGSIAAGARRERLPAFPRLSPGIALDEAVGILEEAAVGYHLDRVSQQEASILERPMKYRYHGRPWTEVSMNAMLAFCAAPRVANWQTRLTRPGCIPSGTILPVVVVEHGVADDKAVGIRDEGAVGDYLRLSLLARKLGTRRSARQGCIPGGTTMPAGPLGPRLSSSSVHCVSASYASRQVVTSGLSYHRRSVCSTNRGRAQIHWVPRRLNIRSHDTFRPTAVGREAAVHLQNSPWHRKSIPISMDLTAPILDDTSSVQTQARC